MEAEKLLGCATMAHRRSGDSKWVGQVKVDVMGGVEMPKWRRRSCWDVPQWHTGDLGIVSGLAKSKLMSWAALRYQNGGGEAAGMCHNGTPEIWG